MNETMYFLMVAFAGLKMLFIGYFFGFICFLRKYNLISLYFAEKICKKGLCSLKNTLESIKTESFERNDERSIRIYHMACEYLNKVNGFYEMFS